MVFLYGDDSSLSDISRGQRPPPLSSVTHTSLSGLVREVGRCMAPQFGSKAELHCTAAAGKSLVCTSMSTKESPSGKNSGTVYTGENGCGLLLLDGEMK